MCTEISLLFGDQKAVIPLMLLGPSRDLFNSSACVVAACGLGKNKRIKLINILAKKDSFVLIKLMTWPVIDPMWLAAISSNF